jgi:polyhydroxyalkanoate synthesis regulator phasin
VSDARSNVPIPDPTLLTTEQFTRGQDIQRRELQALRELLTSEMNRIEKVHEEKFKSIETRFAEGKTALDAALRAAQNLVDAQNRSNAEASEKSERSFTKQIEALDQQTKTITSSQSKEINDLKERFVANEGVTKGSTDNTARVMAVAMFLIALGMAFYTVTTTHGAAPTIVSPAVIPMGPGK